jgi:nicotinamide mononucleotide adenylyltransferase
MKFREFILEQKEKHAVLAFGRMNPPTTGHAKLVDKVKEVAKSVGGSHHVVLSHSQDPKKNPLSAKDKLKHAKRFFPDTNLSTSNKEHPTFLDQAAKLHKSGVTHLHMVAGSDRTEEYKKKLAQYNGTHEGALFNYKKITVHSSGERDPDAEGTEGMSASKMRSHASTGNFKEFKKGVPGHVPEHHAKELFHDVRKHMGVKESVDDEFEELITEGVHDKGIFKAVFLAGGPGSGKDYVLDNTLSGHGMTEINSDKALEFLMDKKGLNKTMPASEKIERDLVRGRAKNMTELRQRLALQGRNGLIINGTGDDHEKVKIIKSRLEELGYDTSMIMVNTRDEVSASRNVERGSRGGRTVPEDVRKQKWDAVQKARPELAKLFGDKYAEFDNSEDLRVARPEIVQAKKDELLNLYKGVQKFMKAPPKADQAKEWVANELQKKDTMPISKKTDAMPHPNSAASEQARKLGLEYYGFGRYGKDRKTTYRSVHDKLVKVSDVEPQQPNIPISGSSMKPQKKVNEEFEELFEAVTITINADTPEEAAKAIKLLTSNDEEEQEVEESHFSTNDALKILTLGRMAEDVLLTEKCWDGYTAKGMKKKGNRMVPNCVPVSEAKKPTALEKFRQAAAERERKHAEIEKNRSKDGSGMTAAIDRLEKQVNKEEVEQVNEISVDSASNYIRKRTFGYVKTMKGQVQPSDVYNKMSDKHKAGIDRAMDRVVKPVKEEVKLDHKHLLKDTSGKVRTFMLRRSAAKEAHINGGVVHKMGNGYVIKIKENEDAKSTNQLFENQTNSIAMRGQTSRSSEGGRASEERNCQEGYNTGKITLSQIRSKKEKVSESIDRGIEPGLSMAQSGENFSRPAGEKLNKKGKVVTELTGDETTASIGDQKEDELKKKGISLLSFKKRNYAL